LRPFARALQQRRLLQAEATEIQQTHQEQSQDWQREGKLDDDVAAAASGNVHQVFFHGEQPRYLYSITLFRVVVVELVVVVVVVVVMPAGVVP
jgi:hypothetical protein